MKRFSGILFCLLLLAACGPEVVPDDPPEQVTPAPEPDPEPAPEPEPEPEPDPDPVLQFSGIWEDLYPGESTSAACSVTEGVSGKTYSITYTSSDPSVASIDDKGLVTAKKAGSTVIRAAEPESGVYVERKYYVVNLAQLTAGYDAARKFSCGHTIYYKAVMQSWDFFDDWFYVCQVCGSPHTLSFTRKPPQAQDPQTYMHLKYYGHGDNIFVERCDDGDWLWVSNYGTLESGQTNRYADSQVLSRVKFREGQTYLPAQADFNFVIPGMKRIIAAYDHENGSIGIWCRDSGGKAWFYVYDLETIKSATPRSLQLTYGISYGSPAVTEKPAVRAVDLSAITPLQKFQMPFNYVPQGYDWHRNRIYFMRGDGAEAEEVAAGTNKNWARVYLINPHTAKTVTQVDVPWVDNLSVLDSEGLTNLGYFEPEGIKIKDGVLYLGFASKDAGSSPPRRVNIFKYSLD